MKWVLSLVLLAACTQAPATTTTITGACTRSFGAVLEAWNMLVDRAPESCADLDGSYDVALSSEAEATAACGAPDQSDELVIGCTVPEAKTIYLLAGRDNVQLVDTSVHEWVHAEAACALGDPDRDHLRARLWAVYGAESVETQAQAAAQIGECL